VYRHEIETPAVLIDSVQVHRNIGAMAEMARTAGVALRPHAKTHKLPAIAHWQLDAGASGITVAKISEAEVMAAAGARDIFIANEMVTPTKLRRAAALARWTRLSMGVDSAEGAEVISQVATAEQVTLRVLIEVNVGLNRCGLLPGEPVLALAQRVKALPGLHLEGLFSHGGHAYGATSFAERDAIGASEGQLMVQTAGLLARHGIPLERISVGSTPTARSSAAVAGVTEVRPGNYVFHDAMQVGLGVATWEDCALRVLATVISRPDPLRAVIDAGSKVLGTDRGNNLSQVTGYGHVVEYPDATLARLSEEHGVITFTQPASAPRIGERLTVIPGHSCVVTNLANQVYLVGGDRVEAVWPVLGRGKVE
jgi:D-serine deaminase-like pyridoxal phosphate-dependent protein